MTVAEAESTMTTTRTSPATGRVRRSGGAPATPHLASIGGPHAVHQVPVLGRRTREALEHPKRRRLTKPEVEMVIAGQAVQTGSTVAVGYASGHYPPVPHVEPVPQGDDRLPTYQTRVETPRPGVVTGVLRQLTRLERWILGTTNQGFVVETRAGQRLLFRIAPLSVKGATFAVVPSSGA